MQSHEVFGHFPGSMDMKRYFEQAKTEGADLQAYDLHGGPLTGGGWVKEAKEGANN